MSSAARVTPATIPERRIAYPNVEVGAQARKPQRYHADVIVVGTGAGGAPVAAKLAEAGLDVLMFEEGGLWRTESFRTDPLTMIPRLYRDAGTSPIWGKPPIVFAEGRCVGGSTVINGGMCWRTPEPILDRWSKQHGLAELSPELMEPYFEQAEAVLNVEPQVPDTVGRHGQRFVEGAERLGWGVVPNRRAMRRCVGLNNCAFGCPTGAKRSMLVTEVPRALGLGARLVTHAKVRKVRFSAQRAVGVEGRFVGSGGTRGPGFTATAKQVVLAAGARHTPGILLRSRLRSPALGRHLRVHPNVKALGVFEERLDAWIGAHQAHQVHAFLEDGIEIGYGTIPPGLLAMSMPGNGAAHSAQMCRYGSTLAVAAVIRDDGEGRVRLGPGREPQLLFRLSRDDVARLYRGLRRTAQLLFSAGARRVRLPSKTLPEIAHVEDCGRIESLPQRATDLELWTVHLMGSARISQQPRDGVTDAAGRVHGAPGLAIADASLFPTAIGVNPQETIVALALRNAERWL